MFIMTTTGWRHAKVVLHSGICLQVADGPYVPVCWHHV